MKLDKKLSKKIMDIFTNCIIDGEALLFKSGIVETLTILKEIYRFNVLKKIDAAKSNDSTILTYTILQPYDKEESFFQFIVHDKAESVKNLFNNADEFEEQIHKNFNIQF